MSYSHPLDIEGLALNGFVREAELVNCGNGSAKKAKLRVKLIDGRLLETECLPYERIARSYLVVVKYLELGRAISSRDIGELTKISEFDYSQDEA
ncbi:MAG: hypothetical protein RMH84_02170 [Sulfolobales archaeon]|nr:hypothetical protein [Sulfolobales archaeon]MCX8208539.1 hypothetical protein [Sulfolobales archaeon]MDW8010384.1 hypothetical protein [Sulfolobales archaeon]